MAVVCCAHPCPISHTPSAASAFVLGPDPWQWCIVPILTFPHVLLALHQLLPLVGIHASGALCPPLPSLTCSQCRVCFRTWLGSMAGGALGWQVFASVATHAPLSFRQPVRSAVSCMTLVAPASAMATSSTDEGTASISSDHGNYIFDPGSIPFHSSLPSSSVPHSIGNCNHVYNPGGIHLYSSNSFCGTSTSHNHSPTHSDNKATEVDGEAATSLHHSQLTTLPAIPPSDSRHTNTMLLQSAQGAAATASTPECRDLVLTESDLQCSPTHPTS
jgi:hypothetical protein